MTTARAALIAVIAVLLLFGGVFAYFSFQPGNDVGQPNRNSTQSNTNSPDAILAGDSEQQDLLLYTENDLLFSVTTDTVGVSELFNSDYLVEQSADCGTNYTASYFAPLLSTFRPTDLATQYHFAYKGESQEPTAWTVTVIPNKPEYATMSKFAGDFSICSAGGDLYPMQATTSNLLFTMSCGTGFDDDSGKPHGCDAVRTFVEPTLKLR